jgi:hypothetical protein
VQSTCKNLAVLDSLFTTLRHCHVIYFLSQYALNDTIKSEIVPAVSATDSAPSMSLPEGTDQTITTNELTITKSRQVIIPWRGEEISSVDKSAGWRNVNAKQIVQAMRTLTNEVETDLTTAAYQSSSRAVGTAGSNPFASNFEIVAEGRQVLEDNGMPVDDGQVNMVVNSIAATKLRNQATLIDASKNASDATLRSGIILPLQGVNIRTSAQIQTHTKGTGTQQFSIKKRC